MSQSRMPIILTLKAPSFIISTFNQALEETKSLNKKEFSSDDIAPQLEKLLKPLLMTIDLTDEAEYDKLEHWAKNHRWDEEVDYQEGIYNKCVLIQETVTRLLPIIKEKQQQKKVIGTLIPISKDTPDFTSIISFRMKTSGANPGFDITLLKEDGLQKTFTFKQPSIPNTISECFTSHVTKKMEGIENPLGIKTIIAPAYLMLRNRSEVKSISFKEACKQQLWVASEWSDDLLSMEACKLFGLEKRSRMAGTFQKELFNNLRMLNQYCQLGLESVVIAALYTCDFDLHLENFMLKMNISCVPEENKALAKKLIERFKKNIDTQKLEHKETGSLTAPKYLEWLINHINELKSLGVIVYFHKIDNDKGLDRYADKDKRVNFTTHRTSPLYVSKGRAQIKTQPTSHIVELTGTDGSGLDQLLLSDSAINILIKNPLDRQIQIVHEAMKIFFEEAHKAASLMADLTVKEKKQAEYFLLQEFYFHLRDVDFSSKPGSSIKKSIKEIQLKISHYLERGTIYQVNHLQSQLYARLIQKEQNNENLTPTQSHFKDFLALELMLNQAKFLHMRWDAILKEYDFEYSKPFRLFSFNISQQSPTLKDKIKKLRHQLSHDSSNRIQILMQIHYEIRTYLKDNSHRRLGKIINRCMSTICDVTSLHKDLSHPKFYDTLANQRKYKALKIESEVKKSKNYLIATTWQMGMENLKKINPKAAEIIKYLECVSTDKPCLKQELKINDQELDLYSQALTLYCSDGTLFQTEEKENPNTLLCQSRLRYLLAQLFLRVIDNPTIAYEHCKKALNIQLTFYDETHIDVRRSYNVLGHICLVLQDDVQALSYCEKSLELSARIYGEDHIEFAKSCMFLANVCTELGNGKIALEYHQKALNIFLKNEKSKNNQSDLAILYENMGATYKELDDAKTALHYQKHALSINQALYTDMHPLNAAIYKNLAESHMAIGEVEEAVAAAERAYTINSTFYEKEHPKVTNSYQKLKYAQHTFKSAKNIEKYKKTLENHLRKYGEFNSKVALSYSNLGVSFDSNGQFHEAVCHYRKALDILLTIGQGNDSNSAGIYNRLAMIFYGYLHDDKTAIVYLEKALFIYKKLNQKKEEIDVQCGLKKLTARIAMKSSLTKYSGTLYGEGISCLNPAAIITSSPVIKLSN